MKKNYLTLLLLLFSLILDAQVTTTSVWKWANGDSSFDSHGRYGTKGVANAANSPYSRNGGRSWTDASGNFWLFGGLGPVATGSNKLNDLWRYSPSAGQWTWISGDSIPGKAGIYGTKGVPAAGNQPGGRTRSTSWIDASGNFWLYGGQGSADSVGSGLRELSDLWKYNPLTNQWTWMGGDSVTDITAHYGTKGVAAAANTPGGRNNAAFWKDAAGNFWLFGGFGYGASGFGLGQLNDLWKYNPVTNEWTWMSGDTTTYQHSKYGTMGVPAATNNPGCRELTINWTDAAGRFWMFGGTGYNSTTTLTELLNEVWRYDPGTGQWTWIKGDTTGNQLSKYGTKGTAAATNNPGGRQGSPSWVDGAGNFWTAGGVGYANSGVSGRLADIWKYNPAANDWTWVAGDSSVNKVPVYGTKGVADTANTPGGKSGHVAWIDGAGNVYLFGGFGMKAASSGFANDLWKLQPDSSHGVAVQGQVLQEIALYPNPARDGLYLKRQTPGKIQWQIVDNTGKVLKAFNPNEVNSNPAFINISSLPAGMYYLQVREAGIESRQFRFLKL
jgi:N-acetylneuraminic acid mutarotase